MHPISKHIQRWRDSLNPLRSLTIARVVALREAFDRGEMADIQWTFRSLERSDADLIALVERRTAAIAEMDWTIKVAGSQRLDFEETLANDQQAALRAAYDRIDNLYEAIEHLSMAAFRGYAHLAKISDAAGVVTELQPVDQWNMVRLGARGPWKYNFEARTTGFDSFPDDCLVHPSQVVCLEHPRPIDHFALPKFVRTSLGEKDWTAFADIYGVPSGIVILPPDVPPGQEADYAAKAEAISEGGAGALPNGADYKPNDGPRGVNPFRGYLDYFTEKLVLVGTGGLLTMLTQSGSGTLAGNAHLETFRQIARGHARKISEALQKQFDRGILQTAFPGKPRLAYFELNFQSEPSTADVVDHVVKLSQAGYQMSAEELSEKTGYELTLKAPAAPQLGAPAESQISDLKSEMPEAGVVGQVQDSRNRIRDLKTAVLNRSSFTDSPDR